MNKIPEKDSRDIIARICSKALEGSISLDEFYQIWPQNLLNKPLYDQIYDDLEDGIEHMPGYFFKKGIDHEAWTDSEAYLKIYLDLILLGYEKSIADLLQCRTFVLNKKNLSQEIIQNSVKEYFDK